MRSYKRILIQLRRGTGRAYKMGVGNREEEQNGGGVHKNQAEAVKSDEIEITY